MRYFRLVSALLLALGAFGQLQVSQASGQTNEYLFFSVGPNGTSAATSSTIANRNLIGFEVWTSVNFRSSVYLIANGVEAVNPSVVGGAPAYTTFQWITPYPTFVRTGNTGGQDAFEVKVANQNTQNGADVFVTLHYSN